METLPVLLVRPGTSRPPRCPQLRRASSREGPRTWPHRRPIAEMKAHDAEIAREQRQIAAKMQAALYQRDILPTPGADAARQATRPRRVLRRRAGRRPPTAPAGHHRPGAPAGHRAAPAAGTAHRRRRRAGPPRGVGAATRSPRRRRPRRAVQNILLGLGGLLLGVAAVVFAAVATARWTPPAAVGDPAGRHRAAARRPAGAGPARAYLDRRDARRGRPAAGAAGRVRAAGRWTGSAPFRRRSSPVCLRWSPPGVAVPTRRHRARAPRFAVVIAAQPVLPLLAYRWISGRRLGAGADRGRRARPRAGPLRRSCGNDRARRSPRPPDPGDRVRAAAGHRGRSAGGRARGVGRGARRRGGRPRPRAADRCPWLRELTWLLHGVAVAPPSRTPSPRCCGADRCRRPPRAGAALLLAAGVALAGALLLRRPPLPDVGRRRRHARGHRRARPGRRGRPPGRALL